MPIGAHMSVSGGLELAFERIRRVGGKALQIFTRNQRQWTAKPVSEEEARRFAAAWQEWGEYTIASHDSYLVNLASPKAETVKKSVTTLALELERAEMLGISYVVMHPGAHLGEGVEAGLKRFVANLDEVFDRARNGKKVMILIETTAGQGTSLGAKFEEIAFILRESSHSDRLGVCLDTCHIFAAGYDFRTSETYRQTFADFDEIIGLDRLKFFHLNDSKKELGSRVDRHEHIGQGKIGLAGFRLLLKDPRFRDHPMTLETPKSQDLHEDVENLRVLRELRRAGRDSPQGTSQSANP